MGFKVRWKPVLVWGGVGLGIVILLGFALPRLSVPLAKAQAIKMASNGGQIAYVVSAMGQEDQPSGAPRYPSDLPSTATAADYLSYLVKADYLKDLDLGILAGPHHPKADHVNELSEKTIAFTIFRISADDPPDTVFLVSKFDVFKDQVVVVRKDGTRRVYHPSEAIDVILQHLPASRPAAFLP